MQVLHKLRVASGERPQRELAGRRPSAPPSFNSDDAYDVESERIYRSDPANEDYGKAYGRAS